MDVPFPLAASSRLISFFTFHISMFFSASLACGALMLGDYDETEANKIPARRGRRLLYQSRNLSSSRINQDNFRTDEVEQDPILIEVSGVQ